ncbi:purine-nucleoside phosphorylase [Roseivirga misakiensis]|uniref:Purine nucleoside phosphorylase n=1 Tax=Roseivirga misakiensis TaxID=1563681 RepID=A0A1E5SK75_9BACT|nr:purine-nucleoside phosphorylase [Roseivirga misakiensis]OEJ99511.1 purine-nucleoside phosphorylase [Roseivirga misakiensis]
MTYSEKIHQTTDFIKSQFDFTPEFGIILGTGLGALVNDIKIHHELAYEDIPGFPVSTVESHKGRLIFGELSGKKVVAMQGRFHYYEGYDMKAVTFPVRVLKLLGIRKLFVSNAAGGVNLNFKVADLMIIEDHIDLTKENPLTGANLDEFGGRFPDMSEPYERKMIDQGLEVAKTNNIPCHEGVYVGVSGPNLETRAEYRYIGRIGGDAVGMSTIPEVIVARHMDLPVFAISAITDLCDPDNLEKAEISKILEAAFKAEKGMTLIIKELIAKN